MTIDHVSIKHKNVNSIQYRVANEKVRFARFRPFPFWKRVHDSFISSDEERSGKFKYHISQQETVKTFLARLFF